MNDGGLGIGCHSGSDVASSLFAGPWPLFELRTTELKDRTLLHLSFDLLFIDVWSLQILHGELIQLAYQRTARLAPLEISFRDYVLSAAQQRDPRATGERRSTGCAASIRFPPRPSCRWRKVPLP